VKAAVANCSDLQSSNCARRLTQCFFEANKPSAGPSTCCGAEGIERGTGESL
jgi:hypothetical protein